MRCSSKYARSVKESLAGMELVRGDYEVVALVVLGQRGSVPCSLRVSTTLPSAVVVLSCVPLTFLLVLRRERLVRLPVFGAPVEVCERLEWIGGGTGRTGGAKFRRAPAVVHGGARMVILACVVVHGVVTLLVERFFDSNSLGGGRLYGWYWRVCSEVVCGR